MTNAQITLVNNTGADISLFDAVFNTCVNENAPLPVELADLFNLTVITVDGLPRGILSFA